MSALAAGAIVDTEAASQESARLKDLGNVAIKACQYTEAIDRYTEAIEAMPTAVLYSNRSLAHLRTESFGLATADAEAAIGLDPGYVKAYYRLGSAHVALGKYKDGRSVFRKVVKLKPKDRDARGKLKVCEREVKRIAFEAAIQTERGSPLSETLDPSTIVVPTSYSGPHIGDDGDLTLEFVEKMIDEFRGQRLVHKKYVVQILLQAKKLFASLSTLVEAPLGTTAEGTPVFSVCGDTHGQFFDLLNIFELNGKPSEQNPYLFNGDFVDRGSFSFEVVMTLLAFKLLYPQHMHMLRGNHETKNMNKIYGFEGEVKHKYDETVMTLFTEVFNDLPLCGVISGKVVVMHGGLFQQDGVKLDDIRGIKRNREPPESGLMSDVLWSDPQPFPGRGPSKRGVGQSFGPDITAAFLENNGLQLLIRSHEVKQDGYLVEHDGKLITVFSAPNYCDQMGNKGAIVRFTSEDCKPSFTTFEAVPHPPIRPMAYAAGMSQFGF